ncbi:MAG: hypothetical protein E7K85_17560 [Clostridium sp.]|uniref:hypothetical protein n=1 Tax=Clostridium TaxID=1485 RepID=UPI000C077465|nr:MULTISPECIES: hypothetical protein [Clostridium]DAU43756.1 MAG TPA: Lysis protein [Caudoviricetes sp.]MDB2122226.1 hypothetical protein [Clostridium paraputrificum]MDU2756676.1 hypothetical protein [Clostridium sp.]MDU2902248.1 hypothetical protein [Clostridium sp.]MDU4429051.1 hypothetical protein [Clostridium sp.]
MKKALVLIVILSTLIISGCTQSKNFTIESKDFTDEQNEIFLLTGSRAFKYDLKNLPKDKSYELNVVYEVYKNKEKVREESILGMVYEPVEDKIENTNISINIQENKIRVTSGGAYSELETEEDIFRLSNYYFSGDPIKINIGDEVYLFHAIDGDILTTESLGLLSKEELDRLIEKNEVNIFIKLVCEEIKK